MMDDVVALLNAMGLTVTADDPMLTFIVNSVAERVKNETNQQEIPEGLRYMAAEMAVGQYLNILKGTGQLEGFDLDAAVKQIQEGDTNITFAIGAGSSTPEQRLDSMINYLMNGRTHEFIRYRKLLW